MKLINLILSIIFISFIYVNNINAEEIKLNKNTTTINNTLIENETITNIKTDEDNNYIKNISLEETFKIDLLELSKKIEEEQDSRILFEWNIQWDNTINWPIFEKKFETFWEKEINLSIYKISWANKELITNKKFDIFVYKTKILQIFEKNLEDKIENFILKSKESGIFIEKIILDTSDIEMFNFKENITTDFEKNNYLVIWWSKDFIFDILSKINTENINKKINIVMISSFNINILQKILQNFTSNKIWLNNWLLLDEVSKYEILKQTNDIFKLKEEITKNNYDFVDLNTKTEINNILFISKFLNNLSNFWFSTLNIYLILIIPFLLLSINIFKHLIGLSPAWILIPISITLLFFKLSLIPTIILILVFLITNIILSKAITKYNLHYTPKITLLTLINIIVFIITINTFILYNLINININDIMLVIFFVLISERLINVIISKEFIEYKWSLINTLIFALFSYLFFNITLVKTFILAYPESIILLIPLAFIIWRFTWLRVTEYFRFRETIKSIEEEE